MVLNETDLNACKIYSLSWTEFSSSLSVAAQKLRNKEDFIDVTINAGGKNFPAHKLVLGAASPLLMDLLKNTTCQHPILMLAGISAFDLETILKFIYHGEVNIDAEKLPALLQAAQFLDIRALSPAALVLNSLPSTSTLPMHTNTVENLKTSSSDTLPQHKDDKCVKNDETKILLSKRKRHKKLDACLKKTTQHLDTSDVTRTKLLKKSFDNIEIPKMAPKVAFPNKTTESFTQGEGTLAPDEKKIVSDLPVICQLCGVTIRQSRNLRRHMDQMHSKIRIRKIEDRKEKHAGNKNTVEDINVTSDATPSLLDFSDESFNQFTEEIFNCSTIPDTDTNSFSNSPSTSPVTPVSSCLTTDITQTSSSATHSTLLCTLSSGSVVPSLNTLLGELCFHLPTTTTVMTSNCHSSTENKKASTETRSSNENFEYTHLENDVSNSNDDTQDIMTFKELDNQLLSACFCTTENDE